MVRARWLVVAALVMACSGTAGQAVGTGAPSGAAEEVGIAVEVWLDKRELRVGDLAVALVRLSNRGARVVEREANTCGVGPAPMVAVQLGGLDAGREWPGLAGEFKRELLIEARITGEERELGRFWDLEMMRAGGNVGCADFSSVKPFAPGDSEQMVLVWRVAAREGLPLMPGAALLRATFRSSDFDAAGRSSRPSWSRRRCRS